MRKKRTIFLVNLILLITFFSLFLVFHSFSSKKFTKEINSYIGNIIAKVEEKYPNITKEEVIELLNSEGEESSTLKELGINEDNMAIRSLQNKERQILFSSLLLFLFLDISLMTCFFLYEKRKEKKIHDITESVKEINKKNYVLAPDKEEEGELSYLKNELYKITVMLKEESENAKKEKEALKTLVEDISHQLKTPLTSIRILLDNLESIDMKEETRREFLRDISVQIEKMNTLTISLLKLARFDAGVITLEPKEVSVLDLFKKVEENVAVLLELHNKKLLIKGDEIVLTCDPHWELEAFTNIVKNAIEHATTDEITITYSETFFYTTIEIQNEGEEIFLEDQKHIFDRFYKSKNASKDSIGIGLSLAKAIIEKDKGTISVTSSKNKTVFLIKYLKN